MHPDAESTPELLPTREGYDRWAATYDIDGNPLIALEAPQLSSLLGDVMGLRALDVGCGTGRHAIQLAAAGANVHAIDFSDQMLHQARSKPGADRVTFARHDLAQPLPFADGAFDRVISSLVLEHIPKLRFVFSEMRRVCAAGGSIIVSNMHPAMMLRGVQARFCDPATGRRVMPAACAHAISDYVLAALESGCRIDHLSEHAGTEAVAATHPRAERYIGWPMLFMMRMRP